MWLVYTALITQLSLSQHTITGNTACHYKVYAHGSVPTHTCRSVLVPILHPDTLPHTLYSIPTTRCSRSAYTWTPGIRGEGRLFFNPWGYFVSHPRICSQGSRIVKKVDLGPIPEIVLFQWRDRRPAIASFRPDMTAKPNVHLASSAQAYHVPLPFEPSSFLSLECSFPLFCLLKYFPFLNVSHKLHLPWRGQLEMISLISTP